jgi:hypothetical protein
MESKASFMIDICLYIMLVSDIIWAVIFYTDYNSLSIFIYAVISSIMYLILFSIKKDISTKDLTRYTIISIGSMLLFTLLSFGIFTERILLPIVFFLPFSYIFYYTRTIYKKRYQIILINFLYASIKVGLIFMMIYFIALMGLGSV